MIKQECPQCGQILSLDETNYHPYERITRCCGLCGQTIVFEIPAPAPGPVTPPKKEREKEVEKPQVQTNSPAEQEPQAPQPTAPQPTVPSSGDKPGIGKTMKIILGVAAAMVVALLIVIIILLTGRNNQAVVNVDDGDDLQEAVIDDAATCDLYVCATSTIVRSKPTEVSHKNAMDTILYSTKLPTYKIADGYAKVSYKGHKGYVPLTDICSRQDLDLLNSLWGDEGASESLPELQSRKALINYFNGNQLATGDGNWQFYCGGLSVNCSTVQYARIYNESSKYQDLYVIISNKRTRKTRLVVFSFDDETARPEYRVEYDISSLGGVGLRSVSKRPDNENQVQLTFTDGTTFVTDK